MNATERRMLPLLLCVFALHAQTLDPLAKLKSDIEQMNAAPFPSDSVTLELDKAVNVPILHQDLDAAFGRSTLFTTQWTRRFEGWILNDYFLDAIQEHNRAVCDQEIKVVAWTPKGLAAYIPPVGQQFI